MILYTRQEDTRKMKIVDEYFGCDVFSTSAMQRYLPHAVYKQMMDVMEKGKELPKEIADVVANAMKDWAMDKGATHSSLSIIILILLSSIPLWQFKK